LFINRLKGQNNYLNGVKAILVTLVTIFIFSTNLLSQVTFTGYLVDSEDSKLKNVEVNLYQDNEKISSNKWSKKFEYNLELETYYTLELVKEGFIPKLIAISTFEGNKGAEPFMFVMELIKEEDAIKGADTDYPTALIKYKKNEGSFNFDVKYDKSKKKAEKEAIKKNKEN